TGRFACRSQQSKASQIVPQSLRNLKILLVDDNATNLEILSEHLTHWGFEPVTAGDGHRALELLEDAAREARSIPLASLDGKMEGMDGWQLARTIKDRQPLRDTAILMLTSLSDRSEPSELKRYGVIDVLTKPARKSRLFDAILRAVNGRQE